MVRVPSPIPWAPCEPFNGGFQSLPAIFNDGVIVEDNPARFLYVDHWGSSDTGPWSPTRYRGQSTSTPSASSLWADDPEVDTLYVRHRFVIGGVRSSGSGHDRVCFTSRPCATVSETGDWYVHLESATYLNQFGYCAGVWLNGVELTRTWGDPALGVPYGTPVVGPIQDIPLFDAEGGGGQYVSFVDCVVPIGTFDPSDAAALDPPVYELLSLWEFHGTASHPPNGVDLAATGSAYDELGHPGRRVWFWFGGATSGASWNCGGPRGGQFHFG